MDKIRVLVLGAHPDDADLKAGGCAAKWRRLGHEVKLVSATDGGAGHQDLRRPELVHRRRAEAAAAGKVIGATYDVLDFPDGELLPTLEARFAIIRLIRGFRPDLVLTHRPNDYHPDHRYTSLLVQDAAYTVTVPAICPDAPHLERNPVIAYLSDDFRKPNAFQPDVVVDVGDEMETILDMLDCHISQFYEWLPFNAGHLAQVPMGLPERREFLAEWFRQHNGPLADRCRDQLARTYGHERGNEIQFVEAFEVSEYGAKLDGEARTRLFPFLPIVAPVGDAKDVEEWSDVRDDE